MTMEFHSIKSTWKVLEGVEFSSPYDCKAVGFVLLVGAKRRDDRQARSKTGPANFEVELLCSTISFASQHLAGRQRGFLHVKFHANCSCFKAFHSCQKERQGQMSRDMR